MIPLKDRLALSVFQHIIYRRCEDYIYSNLCAKYGISFTHLLILDFCLIYSDGIEPGDLAALCVIPKQTLASILDKYEKENLVVRTAHPDDKRRKLIKITEEGKQSIQGILDIMEKNDIAAFGSLDEEEQKQFNNIYLKLINEMSKRYQADLRPLTTLNNLQKSLKTTKE